MELAFASALPPLVDSSQLQWTSDVEPLPVVLLQTQPRRAALSCGNLSQRQQHSLIRWLFCSDGIWPDRRPRREVLGLLMLLKRLLLGGSTPGALTRSLVPRRP